MFLLFHIFIPLLFVELLVAIKNGKGKYFQRFWLILGSIFPDLIDKPLALLFEGAGGRGFFHTPFLLTLICILLLLTTKKKEMVWSFGLGVFFHLLLDIPAVPWFWPLVPIQVHKATFNEYFYTLFHEPLISITELISLIGLVWMAIVQNIIFSQTFINWKELQNYLFQPIQSIKSIKNKV